MAWALISKGFEYRRPGKNVSFSVRASKQAQQLPHDVVVHAVAIKAGVEVEPPTKTDEGSGGITAKIRSKRRTES